MKNHYVMDRNSVMLHRDTLEGCKRWCEEHTAQFKNYGMRAPQYRVFYDTATEPCLTYNSEQTTT